MQKNHSVHTKIQIWRGYVYHIVIMNNINDFILKQAGLLYNVRLIKENTNGGSGNKIFEVKAEKEAFILRAAAFTPRVKERTEFELQWLDFLGAKSDNIAAPIKSLNNNLYEVIAMENQSYILCLFEKAMGKNPDSSNPLEFNESLFYNLGAVMGDLHRLTANYNVNITRPEFQWDNNDYSWRGNVEILDDQVCRRERELKDEIHSLPITKDSYGIIHYDIHIDNFFVKNDKIKLFDFEACQLNWFAADVASAIFFMVQKGAGPLTYKSEQERTEFAETYITSYLKGYLTTNTISKFWINKLDLFIKYQMIDEYIAAQSFWQEELMHLQPWYLKWHKDRIVNNLPYAFVDYSKIIKALPPIPD